MLIAAGVGGVLAGPLAAFLGRSMATGSGCGFSPFFFFVGLIVPAVILARVIPYMTSGVNLSISFAHGFPILSQLRSLSTSDAT
jgi:hypothetical protein